VWEVESEIDKWYHEYVDDVHNYLVYYANHHDVEDLVQETFIKALKGFGKFKGISKPKTWLLAIARNVAIDHLRSRRYTNLPNLALESFYTKLYQPDRALVEHEINQTIMFQINQLKRSYREVILHRVVIGLSITETAETLGWSESKVKSTLHRALKTLRKSLIDDGEGGLTYDYI